MDAVFLLSKIAGLLLSPSNLLLICLLAGGLLWRLSPHLHRFGLRLAVGAGAGLAGLGLLPVGDLLLLSLERRFTPLEACPAAQTLAPAGIIILGGAMATDEIGGRTVDSLNEASDRLRMGAHLARTYPDIPVLVSGGEAFASGAPRSEADAMADLLEELGVSPQRILRETGSRTTAENAALSATGTGAGPWLLVTSAFHMPRAMGTFTKAGHHVIAAPTDWRVSDDQPFLLFSVSDNLKKADLGVREYLGLFGYWLMGRTDRPLPGPEGDCLTQARGQTARLSP